jgi:hypothetical protein
VRVTTLFSECNYQLKDSLFFLSCIWTRSGIDIDLFVALFAFAESLRFHFAHRGGNERRCKTLANFILDLFREALSSVLLLA